MYHVQRINNVKVHTSDEKSVRGLKLQSYNVKVLKVAEEQTSGKMLISLRCQKL